MKRYITIKEDNMSNKTKWEMFNDQSYYDMWAVRPIGDKDFNSPRLFHFDLEIEAIKFMDLLSKCSCAERNKND